MFWSRSILSERKTRRVSGTSFRVQFKGKARGGNYYIFVLYQGTRMNNLL